MAGLYWRQFQQHLVIFCEKTSLPNQIIYDTEYKPKRVFTMRFAHQQNLLFFPWYLSFATIIIVMNFQSVLPEN